MKVDRTETIIIKEDHPKFKIIDQQCFHSKNLYNEANYTIRQKFIEDGEYIPYRKMNFDSKLTITINLHLANLLIVLFVY